MANKSLLLKLFIVTFYFYIELTAQDFNDALRLTEPGILSDARALSMGNAYTALSNDFSAAFFNPAGFGLINRSQLSASFNYNSFGNTTTFFNKINDATNNASKFTQFGVVLPFPTYRGSLVFALGYNLEKDFNSIVKFDGYNSANNSMIQDLTSYNEDIMYYLGLSYPLKDKLGNYIKDTTLIHGGLNQSGSIIQRGNINSWSLSGAIEVEKNVFLGATIDIVGGNLERNRKYWEDDIYNLYPSSLRLDPNDPATADFQSFYLNDIISWDISGWDAKVGFLIKPIDQLNIGGTVKFPRRYTIKETYYETATSSFGSSAGFQYNPDNNYLEYEISTPYEFSFGAAINTNVLVLSGDVRFIDYSQMEFKSGLGGSQISSNNFDIKNLFRNTTNFSAGLEYTLPFNGLAVRAGLIYRPSPFKGDPSEYDKKYITAGFGYTMQNRITINFAYAHGWWKDFGDNYSSGVSRFEQDISRDNISFTFTYNFR
ncbi:OmpP1/FadL family transporter [Melioribacteraceae bacterium 4301-Me]|uniref:OmpP1/FadL family transporter n=1 Tax=Pyranulibacter aquaticus TaxID=3163344 RepID=UPI003597D6D6